MTPLMKQYLAIKEAHRECLLFFRLGDFYELFFEDAVTAAKLLQLTLTSRDKSEENAVPMCGVPYHAAKTYIARLIEAGYKVAICEQMEEPTPGKGIVRREVTQILAPGTFLDDASLLPHKPNYLAAIAEKDGQWGLAHLDLSIGDPYVSVWPTEALLEEVIVRLDPRHLLIDAALQDSGLSHKLKLQLPQLFVESVKECLKNSPFEKGGQGGFCAAGPENSVSLSAAAKIALGNLIAYIESNQPNLLKTISALSVFSEHSVMPLDQTTQTHLEIFKTYDGQTAGSLFHHLNHTKTPMGARLLRQWLTYPSTDLSEIAGRHQTVNYLVSEGLLRRSLRQILDSVYDVERLQAKTQAGRATPRDMTALHASLLGIDALRHALGSTVLPSRVMQLRDALVVSREVVEKIAHVIVSEPPVQLKDGGVIADGVSEELDRLRLIARDGKGFLANLEREERDKTGIGSLKIRYNKVFGYYIEVTHTHKHKVPDYYVRKQTTVNSERYITESLKQVEDEILSAESKILRLEHAIFDELVAQVAQHSAAMKRAAKAIAGLDVFLAFAEVAERYRYISPEMHDGFDIALSDVRHPTLELALSKGQFVSNDVAFSAGDQEMILITGPNMAGKSTVMRQTAMMVILAQIGAFVPASNARIGIVDRIFTRIGASDNLLKGKSTFMMEMVEAADILTRATKKSLIILDEIGRGTSTFDGLSLARAIAEHLVEKVGARTMFATHYHELAELEAHYAQVKGYTMSIKEWQGDLIFLYRFTRGNSSRSYGIEVAKLAGLPLPVIDRATAILHALEVGEAVSEERLDHDDSVPTKPQLDLFSAPQENALKDLKSIDANSLTPLEALNLLAKLQKQLF